MRFVRVPAFASASMLFLLVLSCSFDYGDATVEGERRAEVPQVEIFNAVSVVVRENRLELRADRIATYPERRLQEMEGLEFREYGPGGDLRLEGSAEYAELNLDTEDIELRGSIRLYSQVEGARLESEFLRWEAEARVLVGRTEDRVLIVRDDGSYAAGGGLFVDGRRNAVLLTEGVEGAFEPR